MVERAVSASPCRAAAGAVLGLFGPRQRKIATRCRALPTLMVDGHSIERLVTMSTPSRAEFHAEMERAGREFHALFEQSTPDALSRPSNGTR